MSCVEVPGGSINDDLRNSWLCPACCPGGQSTTSSDIKGLVQQCPERTSEAVNGVDKSASSSVNGKLKTTNGSNGVLSVPKRSNQDSDDSQSLLNKKVRFYDSAQCISTSTSLLIIIILVISVFDHISNVRLRQKTL